MGVKKSLGFKIVIVFVLTLVSCNPDYSEKLVDFVIINESGVDIRINSKPPIIETFSGNERTPLVIENNSAFSELIEISTRYADFSFDTFFRTDNIEVIFNNNRKILFSCASSDENNNCSNQRNILKFIPDSNNRNEYTFTVSDFDASELCDGNCN